MHSQKNIKLLSYVLVFIPVLLSVNITSDHLYFMFMLFA